MVISVKDMKRKSVSIVFYKDDKNGVDETLAFIQENGYDYSLLKRKSIIEINIQDKFLHAFFCKDFLVTTSLNQIQNIFQLLFLTYQNKRF